MTALTCHPACSPTETRCVEVRRGDQVVAVVDALDALDASLRCYGVSLPWLLAAATTAEAGDLDLLRTIYRRLAPYAGRHRTVGDALAGLPPPTQEPYDPRATA